MALYEWSQTNATEWKGEEIKRREREDGFVCQATDQNPGTIYYYIYYNI